MIRGGSSAYPAESAYLAKSNHIRAQCSPNVGLSNILSTKFPYAPLLESSIKFCTSRAVGGRPVRSRDTRLMSASFEASGDGESSWFCNFRRIKLSIGFLIKDSNFVVGVSGRSGF